MVMSKVEKKIQNAKRRKLAKQWEAERVARVSLEESKQQVTPAVIYPPPIKEPKSNMTPEQKTTQKLAIEKQSIVKSSKKKKTVTFQIDEQDLLALTELAKKQDRSISSFIRILIKSAIAINGQNRLD